MKKKTTKKKKKYIYQSILGLFDEVVNEVINDFVDAETVVDQDIHNKDDGMNRADVDVKTLNVAGENSDVTEAKEDATGSCGKPVEVLILGAGAAGISAADALYNTHGIKDFLILEGRDRIGGRVNHVMYKGSKLEMGAAWSHESQEDHTVWQLLNRFKMETVKDGLKVTYR